MLNYQSDEALVDGCCAGDQAAWTTLILRYQRLIFTIPLRIGLSEDEARDVFQATCLRLYEHLDTLRNPARVGSWLASTARNLSLDHIALRRQDDPDGEAALAVLQAPYGSPEDDILQLEEEQRIRIAVGMLPPRCRDLLEHLFFDPDQPSYAEVARRLGLPSGSIGPIRQRCFERLRKLL